LDGDLLPLQLVFEGKTEQCHPPLSDTARDAHFHLTHSINHWSNQETMRQYITEIIVPYAERMAQKHNLPRRQEIILVLDCWSVHKSAEFRAFIKKEHPNIHLVFIYPNCTSELQVADVILQRPFKHGLHKRFNKWAADIIVDQIQREDLKGLSPYLKMASIKPLLLQWCVESWGTMAHGRQYIKMGWHSCHLLFFNILDATKRQQVLEEDAREEFNARWTPDVAEEEKESHSADIHPWNEEENEEKDELAMDVMKERQYGSRKSSRKRTQRLLPGMLVSSQIELDEDENIL
jgi:hypothetical protein